MGGAGEYALAEDGPEPTSDEVFLSDDIENKDVKMPPRYRLRDLLLGDFAFNDDGER